MNKSRLEAFSDGVIAIIITIMVLEIKVPHSNDFGDLLLLWPKFFSYTLSFFYIGLYWNNHHHLMQAAKSVNGKTLILNLILLFWISTIPFFTGWVGESNFSKVPVTMYGINLFIAGLFYKIFQDHIMRNSNLHSVLLNKNGFDFKGFLSPVMNLVGVLLSWIVSPYIGVSIYLMIAIMWLIPDQRIERAFHEKDR